jgi:hypothetical protein
MGPHAFWSLIELIDLDVLDAGDEELALEPLVIALEALPVPELERFEDTLAHALYAIDGRAWADAAGESGQSDDGFLYARCWVVARGRKHYEAVLAQPGRMTRFVEDWCEGLLYVAEQAYAARTSKAWEYASAVSWETGSHRAQW